MANLANLKSLLNRNPLLTSQVKKEILKKWESSDPVGKKGIENILSKTEEKLKLSLVNSFKLKPAKEFMKAWKEFETKLRKEISGDEETKSALTAEEDLIKQLNLQ